MRINRQFTGWIVAAVLAVVLGGVIVYEAASGGGSSSRKASLGSGLPVSAQQSFDQTKDAKDTGGSHQLPDMGPNQQPTQMAHNPQQHCDPGDEPNVFAEWRNSPENLADAGNMSDEIVVGTVTGAKQGRPFSVNVKGEPDNPQITPVQNVTVHVTESVKGEAQSGANVTVQKLGDSRGCFRVAGDEPYQQGHQYLLLLENGAGGRPPHVISPEGRYEVVSGQRLRASNENFFGDSVDGDRLAQVVNQLKNG
jgi:hypothetical protein